jgi:hypothetical protein
LEQPIYIHEGVRLLDPFDMPMVALGVVVVVEHRRRRLAAPDEGQPITNPSGLLFAGWHLPDRELHQVSAFVNDLLVKNQVGAWH